MIDISKLKLGILFWLLLSFNARLCAQQIEVQGHFMSDTLSIGSILPYSLTAKYPGDQQVLFPDSTFSFAPFEWQKKEVFPTRSVGDISFDSVVYYLTTFELDTVQKLQLPVYVVNVQDCVAIKTQLDSVLIKFRVAKVPDTVSVENLPLKTNTLYQKVKFLVNYPLLTLIGVGLLIALIGMWMLFGKQVKKFFLLRSLAKSHNKFLVKINLALDAVKKEYSSRNVEKALLVWKEYMEKLEKYPYTKSTSKEINVRVNNERVNLALRSIDKCIYAQEVSYFESFQYLVQFSKERLKKKEKEVNYG